MSQESTETYKPAKGDYFNQPIRKPVVVVPCLLFQHLEGQGKKDAMTLRPGWSTQRDLASKGNELEKMVQYYEDLLQRTGV